MAGERILVVDDGRENRDFVVEYILQPNGYRASVARDGQEGYEKALAERPDLILLDLEMPRMKGKEVLQALHRENVNIPVILMTFHGSEEIAIEVFRLGVKDYVKKPYTVEEMLGAIERSLTEARLRREKEALTERLLSSNRELQRRIKELNVLYQMGRSVTALLDVDKLLPRVVEAATYVTGAEQGHLYVLDGDDQIVCRATKRQNGGRARAVRMQNNDPLVLRAFKTGQPVIFSPEDLIQARTTNPALPTALLYTPLTIGQRVIGVLGVDNVTEGTKAFTEHDGALLSALGDYAAIAMENAHNFGELAQAKEREKQQIRQAFERYVAPSIVDRVLDKPEGPSLGGVRQPITVLFADLSGYTAYSESVSPEELVKTLNEYLRLAADVILATQGTLDKFLGDAVMAIFNAPDEQPDHRLRAIESAITIRYVVDTWNTEQGGQGMRFSMGIHTGEAVVGNIGTSSIMNYTAIGDAVNLAKRLQERAAPGQILVSEETIGPLLDKVEAAPLGPLQVKGRRQPVVVYELLGVK